MGYWIPLLRGNNSSEKLIFSSCYPTGSTPKELHPFGLAYGRFGDERRLLPRSKADEVPLSVSFLTSHQLSDRVNRISLPRAVSDRLFFFPPSTPSTSQWGFHTISVHTHDVKWLKTHDVLAVHRSLRRHQPYWQSAYPMSLVATPVAMRLRNVVSNLCVLRVLTVLSAPMSTLVVFFFLLAGVFFRFKLRCLTTTMCQTDVWVMRVSCIGGFLYGALFPIYPYGGGETLSTKTNCSASAAGPTGLYEPVLPPKAPLYSLRKWMRWWDHPPLFWWLPPKGAPDDLGPDDKRLWSPTT